MESIYSNKTDFGNLNKQPFYQMYLSIYAVTFVFVLTSNLMLIYGFYKTNRHFKIITKLFIDLSFVGRYCIDHCICGFQLYHFVTKL